LKALPFFATLDASANIMAWKIGTGTCGGTGFVRLYTLAQMSWQLSTAAATD
jgi:hypothetical protein